MLTITLFSASGTLLALGLLLRSYESVRAQRFFPEWRDRLDHATMRVGAYGAGTLARTSRYVTHDILLRGVHIATLVLLGAVHYVETRLVALVYRVRSKRLAARRKSALITRKEAFGDEAHREGRERSTPE